MWQKMLLSPQSIQEKHISGQGKSELNYVLSVSYKISIDTIILLKNNFVP